MLQRSSVCLCLAMSSDFVGVHTGAVASSRPRATFQMCPAAQVVLRRCAVSVSRSLLIVSTVQCHRLVCLAMPTLPAVHRRRDAVSASRDLSKAPPTQMVSWRCAVSVVLGRWCSTVVLSWLANAV
ncbi:hypothetical protein VPH35_116296 [Triticum aestivum]